MKKIIIPLMLVFLITGCSFRYDLRIGRSTIDEIDSLNNTDKSTWNSADYLIAEEKYDSKIKSYIKIPQPVYLFTPVDTYDEYAIFEDGDYYKSKIISNDSNHGIEYSFKHKIDNYSEARIIKLCYDSVDVVNDKNVFSISTSDQFNCFDSYEFLDDVEVNITTSWDYEVISSNADKNENGKYTWYITKDNADNKSIKIELKKVFNWRLALIITIVAIGVISVIYFFTNKRLKNNNDI